MTDIRLLVKAHPDSIYTREGHKVEVVTTAAGWQRGWNITFDASMKTDAEEPIKRLPARDAKGIFTKRQ